MTFYIGDPSSLIIDRQKFHLEMVTPEACPPPPDVFNVDYN